MTSYVPMEEEDLAQIEQVAKETGIFWLTLKMGARKPKLHIIEAHAATCIRQIGVMGFISEEKTESLYASIERLHALLVPYGVFSAKKHLCSATKSEISKS